MIIETMSKKSTPGFLSLGAKLRFVELNQALDITLILHYVDPKYHFGIITDVSK